MEVRRPGCSGMVRDGSRCSGVRRLSGNVRMSTKNVHGRFNLAESSTKQDKIRTSLLGVLKPRILQHFDVRVIGPGL